jgi:beta-lactam-binding protein with PASTA domain
VREENEATEQEKVRIKAESTAKQDCIVPRLKGDTLAKARKALAKAHCRLGKITMSRIRPKGSLVVVDQRSAPGRRFSAGTRVGVILGLASARKHR